MYTTSNCILLSCMIDTIFTAVQLILAVLLVVAILLQQKGSGMGAAFGGGSTVYSTKRGIDKILFRATIVIAVLFFGTALLNVVI